MYAPHGPALADPEAATPLIEMIRELAHKTGAILFRSCAPIAAYPILLATGFRDLTDEGTVWTTGRAAVFLDITGSLDDLSRRMRKKTRQYLERSLRSGVQYQSSLDPTRLYPLLHKNALRQGFSIPPVSYLHALCEAYAPGGSLEIWFATRHGEDVAGLLTITHGRTLHLMHLGLDVDRYEHLKPGYGIYWHVIRLAHERGCTSLNWGAYRSDLPPSEFDEGYSLYWFRAGFGCQLRLVRRYCDLIFKPSHYRCFRTVENFPNLWKLWKSHWAFRSSRFNPARFLNGRSKNSKMMSV
jgi:lipid II:glycine glycyltransferase (peptidoglycan interpeptide bridge formation enzyme)